MSGGGGAARRDGAGTRPLRRAAARGAKGAAGGAGGGGAGGTARPVPPARTRAAVLHELKSPVTAIIGFSDTLARLAAAGTLPPGRLADRLGRIRTAAVRIDELLEELRDLRD